jgi:hypothetical protein
MLIAACAGAIRSCLFAFIGADAKSGCELAVGELTGGDVAAIVALPMIDPMPSTVIRDPHVRVSLRQTPDVGGLDARQADAGQIFAERIVPARQNAWR